MSVGKNTLPQGGGVGVQVLATGNGVWRPIGVTVAWGLVTAAVADTTLFDGTKVFAGEKYIEFGTPMVPITTTEVQTLTKSGSPTGGDLGAISVTRNGETYTTPVLPYNVSAADMQAALEALPNVGQSKVTVSYSSNVWTITFDPDLGDIVPVVLSDTALTGGTTPAMAVGTTTSGSATGGMWAPGDTSQTDGRQTLARGSVGIVNQTVKFSENTVLGANLQNDLLGLLEGGTVWAERLKVGGTNQFSLSSLLAAMPLLRTMPAQ